MSAATSSGVPGAAHRGGRGRLGFHLAGRRGGDPARRYGVDGHAQLHHLEGGRSGQAHQGRLRRGVGRLAGHGDHGSCGGGDIDHPSVAARLHAGQEGARGQEGGAQVARQCLVPFGERELLQRPLGVPSAGERHHAGVVDEDVDRRPPSERPRRERRDLYLVREVGHHSQGSDPLGLQLGRPGEDPLRRRCDHYGRSMAAEQARRGKADTPLAARSGDHRHLVGQRPVPAGGGGPGRSCLRPIARCTGGGARNGAAPQSRHASTSSTAAANNREWRSTSAAVWLEESSAMLWKGVRSTPLLSM